MKHPFRYGSVALLMLMIGGCVGARPERPLVKEDRVRQCTTALGKEPDQSVVLANGMTLRVWRFRQLFSELSPERSTYAVLFDGSDKDIGWAWFPSDESSSHGLSLSECEELLNEDLEPARMHVLLCRLIRQTD